MEIFLFIALIFIYMLMAFTVPALINRRVWIAAYAVSFLITALSIFFISNDKQTVLMQESDINWYFFLYLFGAMSVMLGLINLWIYRHALYKMFTAVSEDDKTKV